MKVNKTAVLHPYTVFSRSSGRSEGAVLVLAPTAQRAKVLAWGSVVTEMTDGDYLDMAVRRMADDVMMFADGHDTTVECAIDDPPHCKSCLCWGVAIVDGRVCGGCGEDVGDMLAAVNERWVST